MDSHRQGANQPQNQPQNQAQVQGEGQGPSQDPRAFGRNIHEPLNFTQIFGYPHDFPEKDYKRIKRFSGKEVFDAKDYLLEF